MSDHGSAADVETFVGWRELPVELRQALHAIEPDTVDDSMLRLHTERSARWWGQTMFEELVGPVGRYVVFGFLLGMEHRRRPGTGYEGLIRHRLSPRASTTRLWLGRVSARVDTA